MNLVRFAVVRRLAILLCLGLITAACSGGDGADSASNTGGTADAPYALDAAQPLSINILQTKGAADWNITVSSFSEIAASPSADDVVFVSFDASAQLVRTEQTPLTTRESFEFTITGGETGMAYGPSTLGEECSEADNTFDIGELVQEEGVVEGAVCLAIPAADLDHPETLISVGFNLGETRFFG